MGNESTMIVDANGKQVKRNCIILLIPPGFEVKKLLDNFPEQFPYNYISIGELIRNQINKKTKYSKLILDGLQKNKKISKQLLSMLLKTVALRDSILDRQQLQVWKQFMNYVNIQMIVIIKPQNQNSQDKQQRQNNAKQESFNRFKIFQNDIKTVKLNFKAKQTREFSQNDDIAAEIMNFIRKNNS